MVEAENTNRLGREVIAEFEWGRWLRGGTLIESARAEIPTEVSELRASRCEVGHG